MSQETHVGPRNACDATFAMRGYAALRRLVAGPARSFLYEYALKSAQSGRLVVDDSAVPGTPSCYGDPFMECLLEMLLPKIEATSGRRLYPTYTYFRVYKKGDVLKRHHDRPSCEISVTLNLGYRAAACWPIWMEIDGATTSFQLEAGDALLYKGIEVPHWRDEFPGEHSAQLFLHYVDQDGPYKIWAYDKRAGLGTSPLAKRVMEQFKVDLT